VLPRLFLCGKLAGLLLEDAEAARFVVVERRGRIQRTRVDPNAVRAHGPSLLDRRRKETPAEAVADELRQQSEMCDLDVVTWLHLKLEVTGRRSMDITHPRLKFRSIHPRHPALFGP